MSSGKSLLQKSLYLSGNSFLTFILSACGGGGGGGDSSSSVEPPPTEIKNTAPIISPTKPLTQDNYNQHLFITHAAEARAAGYTGAGITIGVVDSGILTTNPALQGKVAQYFSYVDPDTNNTAVGDVRGHGTKVAQTLAGQRVAPFSGGTAPGATLVSARIIPDTTTSGGSKGYYLSDVNRDMANAGAKIMNNSWDIPTWTDPDSSTINHYADAYQYFVVSHGGLVVFASGNDHHENPSNIAAIPTLANSSALEKGWLVVSAINKPNELASYANACGSSMRYCLVAPGTVSVLTQNPQTGALFNTMIAGTSFAAPQVSGAAAMVWQAFPYFNNDLVRQTLLGTATDQGTPGVDATFGYGLLNVDAAVRGPAKFDWGDVSVSFDDYSSTWGNSISGTGGLIKNGTGTLVLGKEATYSGLTQVLGGTLASNNGLTSAVNVGPSGTLDVRRVGGNVNNQGSVVLRNGQTHFNQNYNQTADGQLTLVLGSTLNVQGTATLAGDLHVLAVPQGYVTSTQRQDVLTAQGGLSGQFDTFTKTSGVFLDATVGYSSNQAWLNIQRVQVTNAAGVEYNAAATSGANRVEQAFTQLDQQLANSTAKNTDFINGAASIQQSPNAQAAQASLESLSGQLPAASLAMTMQAISVNNRQVSDHIAQLMDSPISNAWTGNINYQSQLGSSGLAGVNYNMNGWVIGQDIFLDKNTFMGSSLTRSETYGSLSRGSENSSGTVGEGSLYGGKIFDSYYVTGRIASGYYDGQQKRTLLLGTQAPRVSSDQSGSYFTLGSEMGYRIKKEGWQLTPYIDTQYISVKQDAFQENGASGFGLQANAQTTTRWQAGLGVRAGYGWELGNQGKINLTAQTHYQQAISQDNGSYNASFTGINQYMPLNGIPLSRDIMMVGSGLEWVFNDNMALNMLYEQYFADNQQSSMMNMNLKVTF